MKEMNSCIKKDCICTKCSKHNKKINISESYSTQVVIVTDCYGKCNPCCQVQDFGFKSCSIFKEEKI